MKKVYSYTFIAERYDVTFDAWWNHSAHQFFRCFIFQHRVRSIGEPFYQDVSIEFDGIPIAISLLYAWLGSFMNNKTCILLDANSSLEYDGNDSKPRWSCAADRCRNPSQDVRILARMPKS